MRVIQISPSAVVKWEFLRTRLETPIGLNAEGSVLQFEFQSGATWHVIEYVGATAVIALNIKTGEVAKFVMPFDMARSELVND